MSYRRRGASSVRQSEGHSGLWLLQRPAGTWVALPERSVLHPQHPPETSLRIPHRCTVEGGGWRDSGGEGGESGGGGVTM